MIISAAIVVYTVCAVGIQLQDGTLNAQPTLVAFPSYIADNNTMYLCEAMQQED